MPQLTPHQPRPGTALTYVPELDGLRAIACALVIFFHSAPTSVFSGGFIGVDIFFVLSGYLITSILANEYEKSQRIDVVRFYWRRALRLMPALLLFLAAYLAIAPLVWPGHSHGRDALLAAIYVSDYTYPFLGDPHFIRHTWSLAVEEQFYLIWPFVLVPLLRARHPLIILTIAWVAVVAWRWSWTDGDWILYYFRFDTRCTGLIVGSALYFVHRQQMITFSPALGYTAAASLVMLATSTRIANSALVITCAEILAFILIGCILSRRSPLLSSALRTGPLIALGKLSYGMYLWHFPIAYYFREIWPFPSAAAATYSLSALAALVSYQTVEAWGRAMKQEQLRRSRIGLLPKLPILPPT